MSAIRRIQKGATVCRKFPPVPATACAINPRNSSGVHARRTDWRPSSTFTLGNRIDVFANAGGQYTPWDTTIPVTVSDGQITIQLLSIANWTFINAIEIRAQGTMEIVPSTV